MKFLLLEHYLPYFHFCAPRVNRRDYYSGIVEENLLSLHQHLTKEFCDSHAVSGRLEAQGLRFGRSYLRLLLELGKPRLVVNRKLGGEKHKVALFRRKIGGYPTHAVCHFLKGQLALVQISFPLSHGCSAVVLDLLRRKYGVEVPQGGPERLLCNDEGDRLMIRQDGGISLFYLPASGAALVPHLLKADNVRRHRTAQQRRQALEQLI